MELIAFCNSMYIFLLYSWTFFDSGGYKMVHMLRCKTLLPFLIFQSAKSVLIVLFSCDKLHFSHGDHIVSSVIHIVPLKWMNGYLRCNNVTCFCYCCTIWVVTRKNSCNQKMSRFLFLCDLSKKAHGQYLYTYIVLSYSLDESRPHYIPRFAYTITLFL